jgi:radical SAM protein with 4Fe4S-binding SPASM domain
MVDFLNQFEKMLSEIKALNVIVNVTDNCVLNCAYCFNHKQRVKKSGIISEKILRKTIQTAFETDHKEVQFEWTGGEPLLAPEGFYEKILQIQKEVNNKPYFNTIQTTVPPNSMEYIYKLQKLGFSISTTIDGPKPIHSIIRGDKSYDRAWNLVKESNGKIGYIITATKKHISHEKEIFQQAVDANLYCFHCNPCLGDSSLGLTSEEYFQFYAALLNEWIERGLEEPKPFTLEYMFKSFVNKTEPQSSLCTFGGRCLTNFVAVTPEGDLYPCPKFSGLQQFKIGTIEDGIKNAISPLNSPMAEILENRKKALTKCEDCPHIDYMNGCCPYESYLAGGIENKSCLCEGKQNLFTYGKTMVAFIEENLNL